MIFDRSFPNLPTASPYASHDLAIVWRLLIPWPPSLELPNFKMQGESSVLFWSLIINDRFPSAYSPQNDFNLEVRP